MGLTKSSTGTKVLESNIHELKKNVNIPLLWLETLMLEKAQFLMV